ncbi:ATP-binding protein [uncultured Sphingomonas sp.]|uniref:sensor histidine kinase n=1 Tax=uncultured Sphingomonas sp. TaxID=158754 RepID=UPI0035CBD2E8
MSGAARWLELGERSIGRFLIGAMALGFALLVAAVVAAALATDRTRAHSDRVAHTLTVAAAIEQAQLLVEQGETARRGYLLAHEQRYLDAYAGFQARVAPAIDRLARLTADNGRQQRNIADYRRRIAALLAARAESMRLVRIGQPEAANRYFIAEAAYARPKAIRALAARMLTEERRLLAIRDADQRSSQHVFYAILAAAGVLLLLLGGTTAVTLVRFARDISASRERLRAFNATLEAQVAARTADLSRANEEIQRFAYIVSHDLRSPLVNVMGFTSELASAMRPLAELVDRAEAEAPGIVTAAAKLAVSEDLPEAIGFIRTSTERMDRLINAILRLSREGRRVITPEPLDVAAIAEASIGSIRHLIDARGAAVEVQHPLPYLVSDRIAIEQILANLIENAIKYLQPGRPGHIAITGAREGGRVLLTVRDNGRGIAPADHERIFDLFRRSGPQDQPGEGIGLAHVRALVYRLGGVIDVESQLGEGSAFRVSLPAIFEESRA